MTRRWLLPLGVSLALTLLIEGGFALLCGKRGRTLAVVLLANVLTNPAVAYVCLLWRRFALPLYPAAAAALEALAVLTEGLVYKKSGEDFSRPYRFSLAANALSFCLGLIL